MHIRWRAVGALVGAGVLAFGGRASRAAENPETEAQIALSGDGHIGAWLVAGPFDRPRAPDEDGISPRLGDSAGATAGGAKDSAAARWRLAAGNDGALDVGGAIDSRWYVGAYAAGVLHVDKPGRYYLLLGVGDAVTVAVDGKRIFSRQEPRPERDDEDMLALDLGAGDHPVVLALHRYGLARSLRARLLDDQLEPPRGSWWTLPGATAEGARTLASKMSSVSLDRGMGPGGYQPVLTVRFPGGAPRGVPLAVHVRLTRTAPADPPQPPLFDVDAGQVALDDRSPHDLVVRLPRVSGDEVEDQDWTLHVDVAGRALDLPFHPRRAVRLAAARAGRAIGDAQKVPMAPASLESVEFLRDRLVDLVAHGDGDLSAEAEDARELDELSASLEAEQDPYAGRTWRKGAMRRAYRSPADGHFSEFALYVPPDFDPDKTYPLIVALHGMNGRPLEMIMWLFGFDDPDRDGNWEDRHPRHDLPPLEAIVVAPDGHFNAMYRDMGEDDVMRVVDWAMATYPIDPARVSVTGPSMGGIGSAACALHHPARFAAAEPLCGYHSYFVRGDIGGHSLHPWEKFIAEQRSNVFWAENGQYLPLYIVHGTKDLPEENSGVLIDRYTELNYDVTHEHPELGHNVWQTTYEDLKGVKWLLSHRRPLHPRALRFRTPRTRWGDDAWLHVRELASSDAWGEVNARIDGNAITAVTHDVRALAFDRDPERLDDAAPVTVGIDGRKITFQADEPIELHKEGNEWRPGPDLHDGPIKRGTVTGPIHDVFHEPILFVWGASDPAQARANEETARAWARVRWGVKIDYPVMSDTEFLARGETIANDKALFLVGNAKSNRLVRELEPALPIRVEGSEIVVGERHVPTREGEADHSQLGAVFIRPNPRRPDRYVVVVEGVGPLGTWRSLSLPDILPDYVVYDQDAAPASGGLLLGAGRLRAGGYFGMDWSVLPEDPGAVARVIPPATPPTTTN